MTTSEDSKKVAIIGAGIGGLATAIYLQSAGFEVDIYEQNDTPGGKAREEVVRGVNGEEFRFDLGPSLFTLPEFLEEVFDVAKGRLSDYMTIKPLDILSKYFYPDGKQVLAYADAKKFAAEYGNEITEFLDYAKRIYTASADIFLNNSIHSPRLLGRQEFWKALPGLLRLDSFRPMSRAIAAKISNSYLRQIFLRYATYNGSNPYSAPATFNMIAHVEHNLGGYLVEEGISAIPNALSSLAEKLGVNIHYNTKVVKFNRNRDRQIWEIELMENHKTKQVVHPIVISNIDPKTTYKKLIGKKVNSIPKPNQISTSALVFYWGVRGIHHTLDIHNIFFSNDYKKEFQQISQDGSLPTDPTIYINITSRYKSDDAPAGHENWFVMVNLAAQPLTEADKNILRKSIITKLEKMLDIDNLESKIVAEKSMGPNELEEQTGSFQGSLYGLSSNSLAQMLQRHPNFSRKHGDLYFVGGAVHPGGGIPLVLKSAKITANLVKDKYL